MKNTTLVYGPKRNLSLTAAISQIAMPLVANMVSFYIIDLSPWLCNTVPLLGHASELLSHEDMLYVLGHQIAQSVERQTLKLEVRGSKLALGSWSWGQIPPN